jgi:hypothetical protein
MHQEKAPAVDETTVNVPVIPLRIRENRILLIKKRLFLGMPGYKPGAHRFFTPPLCAPLGVTNHDRYYVIFTRARGWYGGTGTVPPFIVPDFLFHREHQEHLQSRKNLGGERKESCILWSFIFRKETVTVRTSGPDRLRPAYHQSQPLFRTCP